MADTRGGKNGRHHLAGLLRPSIVSRLAGYEDASFADRLRRDPVMRQRVGGRAVMRGAASASATGRFETAMRTRPETPVVRADRPGRRVDAVHDRRPAKRVTLDMDRSESPAHVDPSPLALPERRFLGCPGEARGRHGQGNVWLDRALRCLQEVS